MLGGDRRRQRLDRRGRAAGASLGGEAPVARVVVAAAFTGPGYARNVGAAHARGDFLAFCDADDVVDSNWLAELTGAATRGDLVAGGTTPLV